MIKINWQIEGHTTIEAGTTDEALDRVTEMLQQFDLPNYREHTTEYQSIHVSLDGAETSRKTAFTRAEACQALEEAIRAIAEHTLDNDDIVTDAVIILGAQYIDDDGDRLGRVITFPRNGSQPPYITLGLLDAAQNLIRNAEREE